MKSLLLLLLLPLLACGHEHPLTDHEHDPQFKYPEMLNFAYIVDIDPPLTGEIPPKRGVLKKNVTRGGREVQRVTINFSKEFEDLTITDIRDPAGYRTTRVDSRGYTIKHDIYSYINQARLTTDCSDPEHTGYIAVRLDWDTGSARLLYRCPDAEWW